MSPPFQFLLAVPNATTRPVYRLPTGCCLHAALNAIRTNFVRIGTRSQRRTSIRALAWPQAGDESGRCLTLAYGGSGYHLREFFKTETFVGEFWRKE